MSTQATAKLTFDAWLAMPETKQRCEVIDGVIVLMPGPTADHQWLTKIIDRRMTDFVEERRLGVVLFAPLDLVICRDPLRTRQPDIMYLSAERTGIRGRSDLRGIRVLEIPPDIAVEVLSPSNARRDILDKLEDYRQVGVLECWIVSPEAETMEVVRLSPEGIVTLAVYGIADTLRSAVLEDFELPLREILE